MRNWKILKWPNRPENTHKIEFTCTNCWEDSNLAIAGMVIAQIEDSLVFDSDHSSPDQIECPHCRKQLELEKEVENVR